MIHYTTRTLLQSLSIFRVASTKGVVKSTDMSSKEILCADIQVYPSDLHFFELGGLIKINDDFFRVTEFNVDEKASGKFSFDWQSKASVPDGIYVPAFTLTNGTLRSV